MGHFVVQRSRAGSEFQSTPLEMGASLAATELLPQEELWMASLGIQDAFYSASLPGESRPCAGAGAYGRASRPCPWGGLTASAFASLSL